MIILINTIACWNFINKISLIWIFTPFARAYVEKLIVPYRYLFGGTVYCNSFFNETKKKKILREKKIPCMWITLSYLLINKSLACPLLALLQLFEILLSFNFHPIVVIWMCSSVEDSQFTHSETYNPHEESLGREVVNHFHILHFHRHIRNEERALTPVGQVRLISGSV